MYLVFGGANVEWAAIGGKCWDRIEGGEHCAQVSRDQEKVPAMRDSALIGSKTIELWMRGL